MAQLKKRQREILDAIKSLGGRATMHQIAAHTGLHVNGVSQSLRALAAREFIDYDGEDNVLTGLEWQKPPPQRDPRQMQMFETEKNEG